MGRKLRLLAHQRQVLCITHLPQVAALGHHHYQVEKRSQAQQTTTAIHALDANHRQQELARMLGGVEISSETEELAGEMLRRAEEA